MRVFLSWSGQASRIVAEALRDWLPSVIQAIEPWLSSEDIPLGGRWQTKIAERLETSSVVIVCLTRENATATWLTYEAGALSQLNTVVCPYLLDLEPPEVSGPLSQFQCAKADRQDTLALLRILNVRTVYPLQNDLLTRVFELHWPSLQTRLDEIRRTLPDAPLPRSIDEKIDEMLLLLRQLVERRAVPEPVGKSPSERIQSPTKPRLFIGSSTEGLRIAELIQLGLEKVAECTVWTQSSFLPGRTAIESVVDLTLQYDFAILVLTPDDFVSKRGDEASGPRDNIVFELGLFTGALGRARTFMVYPSDEKLHLPSDLAGVTAITYAKRSDGNMEATLGPVCTRIKEVMGVA
jgi:Predicted nucleotide-binding protein containing TIR-like domain/TIR domain